MRIYIGNWKLYRTNTWNIWNRIYWKLKYFILFLLLFLLHFLILSRLLLHSFYIHEHFCFILINFILKIFKIKIQLIVIRLLVFVQKSCRSRFFYSRNSNCCFVFIFLYSLISFIIIASVDGILLNNRNRKKYLS